MQFRVYPQRCSRARGAGLLNRDRIGKLEMPAAWQRGRLGDQVRPVQHARCTLAAALDGQGPFQRRRPPERDLGGSVEEPGDEAAHVAAVASVRGTAEPSRDNKGAGHNRASSFFTAATPATA